MAKPTLMIFGLGNVGGQVLEFLARVPNLGWRVVTAGRDAERGLRKTRSAIFGASYLGLYPDIGFQRADLTDVAATAALMSAVRPDIVVNAASSAAWWLRDLLPPAIRRDLVSLGPGIWSAAHMAPAFSLMRAIEKSGTAPLYLNVSYPDVVNVALCKAGPGPSVGVGNIDLLVPAIQHVAARRLGVPMRHIVPYIVAHNHHSYGVLTRGTTDGHDFFLKIVLAGTDVTDRFDRERLMAEVAETSSIPEAAGASALAAGSLCKVLLAIMTDSGERSHIPGPNGLPGGYPAVLGAGGAQLMLPASLGLDEAIAINEEGQRAEGVETIGGDGRIVFTEAARRVLRDSFDLDIEGFAPAESQRVAAQVDRSLKALGARYGLHS
ncbi:Saccharopine dehydrogenase NADP binding domain-containing protein [Tistlia consotensis]|uniref:Saccharopine dehydrogenase NADP binding domain-containing protein n=1 Tax=Tistlia consotensis USBA 355 TaxID=560819 RepID=A0A1Y6B4D7_9PROT|nr:saccharopine dehydrogenase NADP-binding domain-containing protein [Tistlia consotensis]SME88778.1 Saccharopine dehydrogenase NADP binding domain-containing protein [Tistlia consotensis USBA 355]SNR25322.1 Saccharopine dehydrogenase NADP binding domain-containing protein [Tistlia consotensis]